MFALAINRDFSVARYIVLHAQVIANLRTVLVQICDLQIRADLNFPANSVVGERLDLAGENFN